MRDPIAAAHYALAIHVALRLDDRDPIKCAAWMESAERVCGKDSTTPWLCTRHAMVAKRRAEKLATPAKRADAGKADWYADQIDATRERIARNERAIERFQNYPRPDTSDARAAINAPLRQRQRGMAGERKAWQAYDAATRDMPAARARLTWLTERAPGAA